MKITLTKTITEEVKFIKVSANVRYWDDAEINGESCESGSNVPFKEGNVWEPVIDIDSGTVVNWPAGVTAKFHFKVCDAGSYYLLDKDKKVVASIENNYVPDGLCHGDNGYGDYIIFEVDVDGQIHGYKNNIDADDWSDCE